MTLISADGVQCMTKLQFSCSHITVLQAFNVFWLVCEILDALRVFWIAVFYWISTLNNANIRFYVLFAKEIIQNGRQTQTLKYIHSLKHLQWMSNVLTVTT